ncbi:hypothetical protein L0U85_05300, partial [Glycomyces sp. L485]
MSTPSQSPPPKNRKFRLPNWRRVALVAAAVVSLTAGTAFAASIGLPAPDQDADTAGPTEPSPPPQEPESSSPAPEAVAAATASPSADEPSPSSSDDTCDRPAGDSPKVAVTEVELGAGVIGYGQEGDTDRLPMAIAARPSGGSWLTWMGT